MGERSRENKQGEKDQRSRLHVIRLLSADHFTQFAYLRIARYTWFIYFISFLFTFAISHNSLVVTFAALHAIHFLRAIWHVFSNDLSWRMNIFCMFMYFSCSQVIFFTCDWYTIHFLSNSRIVHAAHWFSRVEYFHLMFCSFFLTCNSSTRVHSYYGVTDVWSGPIPASDLLLFFTWSRNDSRNPICIYIYMRNERIVCESCEVNQLKKQM